MINFLKTNKTNLKSTTPSYNSLISGFESIIMNKVNLTTNQTNNNLTLHVQELNYKIDSLVKEYNGLEEVNYLINNKQIITDKLNNAAGQVNNNTHLNISNIAAQDNNLSSSHETKVGILNKYINYLTTFNSKIATNQFIIYHFNKSAKNKIQFNKAVNLLRLCFLTMGCLISRPVFQVTYTTNNLDANYTQKPVNKIIIQLFYFIRANKNNNIALIQNTPKNNNILSRYRDKFQFLTDQLNNIFGPFTEIELELVRLTKPYYNSHILVQDLALKSYKNRFVRLASKLFKNLNVYYPKSLNADAFPSYISGINIKLAGRTFKERIIPRMTVKRIQKGSLNSINVKFVEKARFTGKTKRGAYSFTVTLGHIFN